MIDTPTLANLRVLFWMLAVLAILLPPRWSLFSYILLTHVDLSGPMFDSTYSLGIENGIKVVIIPTVLLLRFGWNVDWPPTWKRIGAIWITLFSLSAITIFWTPYRLSALKMDGYLYSYFVIFAVLVVAWRNHWIDARLVTLCIIAAFVLALIQTYPMGDPFGREDETTYAARFTSFCSPQAFAAFMLGAAAVIAAARRYTWIHWIGMSLAALGVILSGSRYAFGGMLCFMIIFAFGRVVRRSKKLAMAILKTVAAGIVLIALIVTIILQYDKNNRMMELLTYDLTSTDALEDIGTVADRFSIYTAAFDALEGRSLPKTIFGTGTSSGTTVMLMAHPELADKVDGNRAFHNECLRAFYEWGVVGLALFLALWFFVARDTWILAVKQKSLAGIACLAFLPAIFFGLMIENMLANSGAPGGMGFVLVLSLSAATAGEYYARSNGTISAPAPNPRRSYRAPAAATNPRPAEG
jgi:hypothetical protein